MKSRRNLTYGLFAVGIGLIALGAAAMPHKGQPNDVPPPPPPPIPIVHQDPPPPPPLPQQQDPPKVEVVFALDTTGSMTGLIDGAKRKIWSVANFIQNAQPKPEVRIGLVAYRDIGDDYVTRFYDLSDDMDTVFEHLSSFHAAGGGDTPEHVAKALHDAVDRTSWSQGDKVVKMIYLVGDAPPHTDYQDGYDYRAIARRAAKEGIHVNTILCGHDEDARMAWNEISRLGGGEYASIAQNGGVAEVATPYDDRLAELNRRLTATALGWGSSGRKMAIRGKMEAAMAAPAPMAADRAGYVGALGGAVSGDGDLVADVAHGKAKIGAIPTEELPDEMKGLAPEAQKAFVAKREAERKALLDQISTMNRERSDYLKGEAKKSHRAAGFDDEVRRTVEKQAGGMLAF